MPMIRYRIVALLALLPAGCADLSAISPGTSPQQVQARAGAPSAVWKNTDGSEVWEYSSVPLGLQTYMVSFGPDHAVREVHQVLSEEYFSKVRKGMSRDEIRRIFGKPGEISYFPSREEEIWSWRYLGDGAQYMFFNVHFDRGTGTVRTASRTQEFRTDRND
jgi:hypothetical protein